MQWHAHIWLWPLCSDSRLRCELWYNIKYDPVGTSQFHCTGKLISVVFVSYCCSKSFNYKIKLKPQNTQTGLSFYTAVTPQWEDYIGLNAGCLSVCESYDIVDMALLQIETTGKEKWGEKQCETSDYNLHHTSILGYTDELVRGRVGLHSFTCSDINSWTCFDLYDFSKCLRKWRPSSFLVLKTLTLPWHCCNVTTDTYLQQN